MSIWVRVIGILGVHLLIPCFLIAQLVDNHPKSQTKALPRIEKDDTMISVSSFHFLFVGYKLTKICSIDARRPIQYIQSFGPSRFFYNNI